MKYDDIRHFRYVHISFIIAYNNWTWNLLKAKTTCYDAKSNKNKSGS